MLPDAKWLDALKLPLKVQIGVALACGGLIVLDWVGKLDLALFGSLAPAIVLVLFVVTMSLSLVSLGAILLAPVRNKARQEELASRRAVRAKEQKEQRKKYERLAIARLTPRYCDYSIKSPSASMRQVFSHFGHSYFTIFLAVTDFGATSTPHSQGSLS